MIYPDLNEALINLETEDSYEKSIVFRQLYRCIYNKGLRCFDRDGTALGMDGEEILQRVIAYYTERRNEERCWRMRQYLLLYRERFAIETGDGRNGGSAEFIYLPAPNQPCVL